MKEPIADLHCHPSLKPHLDGDHPDIWKDRENPAVDQVFRWISIRKFILRFATARMALKSQSNLDNCFKGGNRLVFCSIYPFEREFLRPDRPFKRARALLRWGLQLLLRRRYHKTIDTKLIRLITGIGKAEAASFLDQVHRVHGTVDYMADYRKEYNFLIQAQGKRPGGPIGGLIPEFRLLQDVHGLPAAEEEGTIAGILTVEGAHAFGSYRLKYLRENRTFEALPEAEQNALLASFRESLAEIKDPARTRFPPFFITFSHHFHNFLGGHSRSFAGLFSKLFNQQPGMDAGLSALGREVLRILLERGPGSARILVDTKHMSPMVRRQYYQMVLKRNGEGDRIPIISSHTAVSGMDSLDSAMKNNNSRAAERRSYVSKFEINLTDEDIREVFDSGGLIGICMHDGRMPGKKFRRKLRAVRAYPEKAKRLYAQMFLTNVFHIVKVNRERALNYGASELAGGSKNAAAPTHARAANEAPGARPSPAEGGIPAIWKTVCLGSDNDGIVDPFNTYETAADLPAFREKIIEALNTQDRPYMEDFRILSLPSEQPMEVAELRELMMGLRPEQIAERIFYGNIREFLQRYFTRAYRFGEAAV